MTQTGLPHGEAWLLEIAVSFDLRIASLTRPNLANWLNRGHHHLSAPELGRTLRRMFDQGDIEAFYPDNDYTSLCASDARFFNPPDETLDAAINGDDDELTYRLTIHGAFRWESLSRPNWDRYFEQRSADGNAYELITGSRERLLELVRESKTLWNVIMSETNMDVQLVRPWQISHWKTLPVGYRALVEYVDCPWLDDVVTYMRQTPEERQKKSDALRQRYNQIRHWADSICGHGFV